jgi:hypothetical protein
MEEGSIIDDPYDGPYTEEQKEKIKEWYEKVPYLKDVRVLSITYTEEQLRDLINLKIGDKDGQ